MRFGEYVRVICWNICCPAWFSSSVASFSLKHRTNSWRTLKKVTSEIIGLLSKTSTWTRHTTTNLESSTKCHVAHHQSILERKKLLWKSLCKDIQSTVPCWKKDAINTSVQSMTSDCYKWTYFHTTPEEDRQTNMMRTHTEWNRTNV